jgi:predicted RNase H-like HicB family nuclease
MTVDVLVRREPGGRYKATVLGWPDCTASADSRDEAIERTRQSLANLLSQAEIVQVEVGTEQQQSSLAPFAGMWADDETWDTFVAAMQAHRREIELDECQP